MGTLAYSEQESKLNYLNDIKSVSSIPMLHALPDPSMLYVFKILFLDV